MLNPKVMVGECSIQVLLRGELVMSIPHRLWESGVGEEGEVVWSGELRGDHTTMLLVRYLEGRIRGSEDQGDLFNRLDEVMGELRSSQWQKTMKQEWMEKEEKKKEQERERKEREMKGRRKAPARGVAPPEQTAPVEGGETVDWRQAA